MKKKILVFTVILCIFSVAQAHSIGFGIQANFYTEFGEEAMFAPGFSLLFSPTDNFHIAANYYIEKEASNIIGFTADWAPVCIRLAGSERTLIGNSGLWSFNFTAGVGGFFNIRFYEFFDFNEKVTVTGGLRIPLGVNLLLGNNFEIFTHVAPSFGLDFVPEFDLSNFFLPVALGARIWIR